jgi:hypothetical protein
MSLKRPATRRMERSGLLRMCDFTAAADTSSMWVSVVDMLGQSSVGELNEYELSSTLQEERGEMSLVRTCQI